MSASLLRILLLMAMALAGPSLAAEIKCRNKVIQYVGGVEGDDPGKLSQEIRACYSSPNEPITLSLSSNGGNARAGLQMAEQLAQLAKRRVVKTVIQPGAYCISACTSIFLGGGFREVRAGASFEPHGFSSWNADPPAQVENWADGVAAKDLNPLRLRLALNILNAHLKEEGRAPPHYLALIELLEVGDYPAAQNKYKSTPEPFKGLLDAMDGRLRLWLVETQRVVALRTLVKHISKSHEDLPPEIDGIDFQLGLEKLLDGKLNQRREFRKSIQSTPGGEQLLQAIRDEKARSEKFSEDIWRMLESRSSEIDVRALIHHMFSTSILYTRPLAREELCDSNIMNIGCD